MQRRKYKNPLLPILLLLASITCAEDPYPVNEIDGLYQIKLSNSILYEIPSDNTYEPEVIWSYQDESFNYWSISLFPTGNLCDFGDIKLLTFSREGTLIDTANISYCGYKQPKVSFDNGFITILLPAVEHTREDGFKISSVERTWKYRVTRQ
ncbi:hypothetical protein [Reinekea marinisedimentorum]|uniref:Lipocalin-like protein n=1 Tax=Reinekea marinisedimentorum TaxID=230495 RepID=A0A4R3I7Q6_9GAMM|nr:hypothetical protein [Reinekea marinisedimentorum]TCS41284.1 hypothetical protein BCF53_10615 [Reinekea marinisedimentorum]